jgi:hypothetical protein
MEEARAYICTEILRSHAERMSAVSGMVGVKQNAIAMRVTLVMHVK